MPLSSSALRMLVVDDNHDVADVMAELLRIEGHDVRVAYSGSHALDVASGFAPQVVIMDITMPRVDGFDTTALLRAQTQAKDAVFVAYTARDRTELSMRPDVVFDFHVRKPATVGEFASAIEFTRNLESDRRERLPDTLGDVLYADSASVALESEWVELVRSIAAGNSAALHALFDRAQRPAFTLVMRILGDREHAEDSTLDVFDDIWRRAGEYDPAGGTVLGWIMNQARSRAIGRSPFNRRKGRAGPKVEDSRDAMQDGDRTDVIGVSASCHQQLARRIAPDTRGGAEPPPASQWSEPEWREVSPGIFCKVLATDPGRHRVSMLVRLLPGVEYPSHIHAEVEELHLLDGELWIDERKLRPGDYNRAEAPSGDQRVWSETGCTCVLMTSTRDILT